METIMCSYTGTKPCRNAAMKHDSHANRTLSSIAFDFMSGALLGLIPALMALAYSELKLLPLAAYTGLFACFCGTLSAIWGKKFMDKLSMLIDAIPPFE